MKIVSGNLVLRLDLLKDSKMLMNTSTSIGKVFTELCPNFKVECVTFSENKSHGYSECGLTYRYTLQNIHISSSFCYTRNSQLFL